MAISSTIRRGSGSLFGERLPAGLSDLEPVGLEPFADGTHRSICAATSSACSQRGERTSVQHSAQIASRLSAFLSRGARPIACEPTVPARRLVVGLGHPAEYNRDHRCAPQTSTVTGRQSAHPELAIDVDHKLKRSQLPDRFASECANRDGKVCSEICRRNEATRCGDQVVDDVGLGVEPIETRLTVELLILG